MTSFSKASLAGKWDRVREELSHAFSTTSDAELFTTEDLALLERVANAVVKRGMAAPATMFLESMGPMNFLGSQALHFITPIIDCVLSAKEVEQVARLLERRDTVTRLIAIIEAKSAPQACSFRLLKSNGSMTCASSPPKINHPLNVIVATDCGSTTTKAILIEKVGDEYRQTYRGEAPTTVEAPFEDVTRGVLNAIAEIEELSGRKILDGDKIITPCRGRARPGVDIYISTSSAGGGLQMMVTGVVQNMTGESAQRAALGAGAIVIDVLASNDGRLPHEKIERIRTMRPDMILMSGGTDGGAVTHVVEMAEYIAAAEPRPRFGATYKLAADLCGQQGSAAASEKDLGREDGAGTSTDNIRPVLERENLAPARNKIHDLFLEHVMQQAPGYKKLIEMAGAPIMPTPGGGRRHHGDDRQAGRHLT